MGFCGAATLVDTRSSAFLTCRIHFFTSLHFSAIHKEWSEIDDRESLNAQVGKDSHPCNYRLVVNLGRFCCVSQEQQRGESPVANSTNASIASHRAVTRTPRRGVTHGKQLSTNGTAAPLARVKELNIDITNFADSMSFERALRETMGWLPRSSRRQSLRSTKPLITSRRQRKP